MHYLIITIILLVIAYVSLTALIDCKKNWPKICSAWNRMLPFERKLFNVGLIFCITTPVLKDHPAAGEYISRVILEAFPTIGSSFLTVGIVEFMRQMHKETKSGTE